MPPGAVAPPPQGISVANGSLEFRLVCHDWPGILRQVAAILSCLDVGIETLDTRLSAEPHSGVALILVEASVRLPVGLEAAEVQASLEDVSPDVIVDLP